MYSIRKLTLLISLIIFPLSTSAVVLEQAPYSFDGVAGGNSYLSVGPAGTQVAEDFQFVGDVTLTAISWWGSYDPVIPLSESFTVRVFSDDGTGDPAINPLYETVFTGSGDGGENLIDLFGAPVFRYDAGVNWLLQGGEDYYLSIFNNDGGQDWYWLESQAGDNTGWYRSADADPWLFDNISLNMSFRLIADSVTNVPEPATLFLLLLPLLWFARESMRFQFSKR